MLTSYDANGGYGHRDHVQVHRVGARAASLAGTPCCWRRPSTAGLMRTGVELATSLGYEIPPDFTPDTFDLWYTPAGSITHAVDVSAHLEQKKAAMRPTPARPPRPTPRPIAPSSCSSRLPDEYFALAFGTEWFVQVGRPAAPVADDIFSGR